MCTNQKKKIQTTLVWKTLQLSKGRVGLIMNSIVDLLIIQYDRTVSKVNFLKTFEPFILNIDLNYFYVSLNWNVVIYSLDHSF